MIQKNVHVCANTDVSSRKVRGIHDHQKFPNANRNNKLTTRIRSEHFQSDVEVFKKGEIGTP